MTSFINLVDLSPVAVNIINFPLPLTNVPLVLYIFQSLVAVNVQVKVGSSLHLPESNIN